MAYGEIKVDSITFTANGSDATVSVSGLVQNPTFSGDITVTGTISGDIVQGGTLVSGATVSGTAGEFGTITGNTAGFTTVTGTTVTGTTVNAVSGVFTTQVSGATVTGNTGQFTNITGGAAGFTSVTGTTVTGTTANFTSGVFTTQIFGTTITGNAGQFSTLTGGTAGFTTITGTTVTGTTANFVTVSGTTVTGGNGNFTAVATTTANVTSGVFASGTAGAPSVSVGTTDNGIYSPDTDQVAISTNGTGRLFINANGSVTAPQGTVTLGTSGAANAIINSADGIFLNIDSDNTTTGEVFVVGKDRTGASGGTELFRITEAGLVGIGTNSPNATLHVNASLPVVKLQSNGASSTCQYQLLGRDGSNVAHALNIKSSDSSLTFGTGGNAGNSYVPEERLRITSDGKVGVGTSSPG
jgi:hypothetical protein